MPILRKHKTREFTTVDNKIINDSSISSRAKFLYVYMLSKPDDWKFSYKSFIKEIKEGKEYIQGMVRELKEAKLLTIEQKYDKKGRFEWIYTLYEEPFENELKNENLPQQALPVMDEPSMENQEIILQKNIINKDKEDKPSNGYTSSFFNPEEHNRLTLELIDCGYLDKEDLQLYYYDDFFEDLLNKGNSYKDLITVLNYVTTRVISRDFKDEEGYEIKNKLGYLKNAVNSNLDKLNNVSTDLYEIEGYDWLNDDVEDDFELWKKQKRNVIKILKN